MICVLLALLSVVWAQSPCGKGAPGQLATVAVWVKYNDSQSLFRISDEDLTDEGFKRSPIDRDLFPIQLARQPGSCPVGLCAFRLSASRRIRDGALIQQEDVFGVPDGFVPLHDDFYCGRAMRDCGADVPVYRFVRGRGAEATIAYSLDSSASLPGFARDPRPLCYAWSDSANSRRPVEGDYCLPLHPSSNSHVTYSQEESASFSVGTTATMHCSSGYVSIGSSSLLCTRSGWNPPQFGPCLHQPTALIAAGPLLGSVCTAAATVKNGQIIYSQLELAGKLPSGTTASILCFLGFLPTSSSSPRCENGDWIGEWPHCVPADSVHCQPLAVAPGARISYDPLETPFAVGATATLRCPSGGAIAGAMRSTCGKDGWLPKNLGVCVSGLPCGAVFVFNGNATYIQANTNVLYSAGTSVLVTCNPGFQLQGSGSSICQNGQWSPSPGTCSSSNGINSGSSGAVCTEFFAPMSGSVSYSLPTSGFGRPSGTVATLSCNVGFSVSGALSSTCSNGIWSPSALGTCISSFSIGSNLLECANPFVMNGMISYSQSTPQEPVKPVGTVATLSCNLGFTSSGAVSSTCQNGIWTPALGTCSSSSIPESSTSDGQCFAGLFPPMGATLTYSNGASLGPFPSGTVASLRCTNGVTPSGTASSTCSNGNWSPPSLGTCSSSPGSSSTCPAPMTPSGGSITFSQFGFGSYPSGTVATLTCTSGTLTGTPTATCQNGQFTPVLGTCGSGSGGSTCPAPTTPSGGSISFSQFGFGTYPSGTVATLTCTSGTLTGTPTATCQNGQFTPVLGTCGSGSGGSTCPAPTTPSGGSISFSQFGFGTYPSGTVATLTCTSGTLAGTSTATCQNGQFTPILGTCGSGSGGTTCPAISPPMGASLNYSSGGFFGPFQQGTTAFLSCFPPNTVVGSSSATCQNGQWVPSLSTSTCSSTGGSGASCPFGVSTPFGGTLTYSNGAVFGPFPTGTTVTLSCNGGFVQGQSTATCNGGQWGTLGTCGSTGGTTGSQCPSAPPIPLGATVSYSNGAVFGPFPSGTIATMRCAAGSSVQGSSTSTCTNGQWSSLGLCSSSSGGTTQCTNTITVPSGGTVSYSNGQFFAPFNSGTVATLTCTTGFVQGSSTATCTNGIWSQLGSCSGSTGGSQCFFTPLIPTGGSVSYSNGLFAAPFPSGTIATLQCSGATVIGELKDSRGSRPSGSFTSTCSNGQWTSFGSCSGSGTAGSQCLSGITYPLGGSVTYSNQQLFAPFASGTMAMLTCNSGSVLGASTATCTNGQWTTLGTCSSSTSGGTQQCAFGITNPIGGTISYSTGSSFPPFPSGSTATLQCSGGFVTGSTIATCSNGIWSTIGTCSSGGELSCQISLPTPSGGSISYSNAATFPPFPSRTTATLTCSVGRPIGGSTSSTCSSGTWVPSSLANCTTVDLQGSSCAPVAVPFGGTITYNQPISGFTYLDGTTATLTCSSGFPSGTSVSVCSNGVWQPSLGTCSTSSTPQQCSFPPTAVSGGTFTYSNAATFGPWPQGTTVTLTCSSGLYAQGSSSATCYNGSWTSMATSCSPYPNIAVGCLPFSSLASPIAGGLAFYNPSVASGYLTESSTAFLLCDQGFYASGPTVSTCTLEGWQPPSLGVCLRNGIGAVTVPGSSTGASCTAQVSPFNGNLIYSTGTTFGPFPSGTTVSAVCNQGYAINGASTSLCSNGQWIPSALGTCTGNTAQSGGSQCFTALTTSLGTINYSTGQYFAPWPSGTTATLVCSPPNFFSSGASSSVCTNGQWIPSQLGSCSSSGGFSPTSCQAIPFILNGAVTYSSFGVPPYSEGTTATLVCNLGSSLSGQSTVTCRGGGWVPFPGLGSCQTAARSPARDVEKKSISTGGCPGPRAPPLGEISFSKTEENGLFPVGTTAALRCNDGHSKKGATFSTCREGAFRPLLGQCDDDDETTLRGVCLPLRKPSNGKVTYIQSSARVMLETGSTALLDCDNGFVLTGRATLSCSSDGSWQPADGIGKCEEIR